MNPTKKSPKISEIFFCEKCNYKCSKQSEYYKHIMTLKHKNLHNPTFENKYNCHCGKTYKHSSTFYTHRKKCLHDIPSKENGQTQQFNGPTDKDLIMMLIKKNDELQNMMMKVIENGTHNTTNNTTNSHNKAFNLNFFLNETCKDAMNIMDFVESIQLQLTDLENVGKLGYVEGITNIITKNLKALDVTQRPIHCTDKKREVLYIKDDNKWEKEDDDKKKIRKAIKRVASKNHRLILKFKEAHPDCLKASSNFSDQYNKIIIESCGGSGDNDVEKEDKIIHNISKTVIVDK